MTRFARFLAGTCVAFLSLPAFATTQPVIAAVYPATITVGQPAALELAGTGFIAGAQVLVNGTLTRTVVYANTVAVSYLPEAPSKVQLEIKNPDGTLSKAFAVTVIGASPLISGVSPAVMTSGQPVAFQVAGSNFRPGAVVLVNGKVEPSLLVASTVVASYIAVAPSALQVAIRNSDGTTSSPYTVTVKPAQAKTPAPTTPVSTPVTTTTTSPGSSGSKAPGPTTTTTTGPGTTTTTTTPPGSTTTTTNPPSGSSNNNPPPPAEPPTNTPAPAGPATAGTTYYVRPDGGTRYSSNMTSGQCDGMGDAPYSGVGVNQHCAFSSPHFLWQDGFYPQHLSFPVVAASFPSYGWIGKGGDTYLIRGSLGTGITYRIGWPNASASQNPGSNVNYGIPGDPYDSGIPTPPSGTAAQPTRILGENYANCSTTSAKTQFHGGYGMSTILDLRGTSHVDVECIDMTDFSDCVMNGDQNQCNKNIGSLSDFVKTGISWNNKATDDTLNNVNIHGLSASGMNGPTGNGVVMTNIALIGNALSGWNADGGDGTTGTGTVLMQNYNISWNGCSEEYPIVDATPYKYCTDDNSAGYGDGFGTASTPSNPGWNVTFDQGVVSYNTQDGLDALHLTGPGSSVTITRTLAYGNMGQQLKAGTAIATLQNNVVMTNCNALRQAIPGTPAGYNSQLSDFCRAADTGIVASVGKGTMLHFDNNTVYSASATTFQSICDNTYGPCDSTSKVDYRNNIFIGFLNNQADGYVNGGTNNYANPIYDTSGSYPFGNKGSLFSNNLTFHPKTYWTCPTGGETNPICGVDPNLTDETWHLYGYPNAQPLSGSVVHGAGVEIPGLDLDFPGKSRGNPMSVGAFDK